MRVETPLFTFAVNVHENLGIFRANEIYDPSANALMHLPDWKQSAGLPTKRFKVTHFNWRVVVAVLGKQLRLLGTCLDRFGLLVLAEKLVDLIVNRSRLLNDEAVFGGAEHSAATADVPG